MILMKYKDKINEARVPFRARETAKKAELEVCKLESLIAEKEQIIQELSSNYPIDFNKLIDSLDQLELTKRRKEQFEIILEMFGE